jgi:dephospho-CoA kinase
MLVVGLTGGIASGKSTVSTLLREEHRLPLIDLDVLAREVVEPGSATLARLRSTFGDGIISSTDGTLDRPALGRIIFNDAKQRSTLNGIMHPAIRKLMAWKLLRCWLAGEKVVVVDAPLLVEAGLWRFAGKIILVYWCVSFPPPLLMYILKC